jgi:hypothetical protein
MSNVNIVKVTVFTEVKAEQFKCTDERSSAGGGGRAITFQCQVRGCRGKAPARVSDHCSVLG